MLLQQINMQDVKKKKTEHRVKKRGVFLVGCGPQLIQHSWQTGVVRRGGGTAQPWRINCYRTSPPPFPLTTPFPGLVTHTHIRTWGMDLDVTSVRHLHVISRIIANAYLSQSSGFREIPGRQWELTRKQAEERKTGASGMIIIKKHRFHGTT